VVDRQGRDTFVSPVVSLPGPCRGALPPLVAFAHRSRTLEAPLNLTHLDYLSDVVELDGQPTMLTHIYCEAGAYLHNDAADEGIAAVDDVARAALVYLNHWDATGTPASLTRARAALNFVLRMQNPAGAYYNFVTDRAGTINTEGITSRDDLDWWTCRALLALARGCDAFAAIDPVYTARLREAYLRTEGLIARQLTGPRSWRTLPGHTVPGWFLADSPTLSAVAALGLVSYQATVPNPTTAALLTILADALAAFSCAGPCGLPWGVHPQSFAELGLWHAWGAHSAEALARAGGLLGRADWLLAAGREVDGFFAWQLATERIHELQPLPLVAGQQSYGVNGMVQAALALHAATGKLRYARMAGLHAAWFYGNNAADLPLYDTLTGRGFDGIDGEEGGYRINLNAGAESTIEALLALQAVNQVPEAARFLPYRTVRADRWQTLRARNAALHGPPAGQHRDDASILRDGDTLTWHCQIPEAGEYVLYVGRPPAAAELHGTPGAALTARLARQAGPPVGTPAPDDYPWLQRLTPLPLALEAGEQTIHLRAAGAPGAIATVAGVLLHPLIAHKTLVAPDGRELHLRYQLGRGLHGWNEVASKSIKRA
jgi:hypothetical protein